MDVSKVRLKKKTVVSVPLYQSGVSVLHVYPLGFSSPCNREAEYGSVEVGLKQKTTE